MTYSQALTQLLQLLAAGLWWWWPYGWGSCCSHNQQQQHGVEPFIDSLQWSHISWCGTLCFSTRGQNMLLSAAVTCCAHTTRNHTCMHWGCQKLKAASNTSRRSNLP